MACKQEQLWILSSLCGLSYHSWKLLPCRTPLSGLPLVALTPRLEFKSLHLRQPPKTHNSSKVHSRYESTF